MNICSVDKAVKILQAGDLVVVPTETVYGLAADGLSSNAVGKIFLAKGRPKGNPLILHVDSLEMAQTLVLPAALLESRAQKLIKKFWPGSLTLIFDKSAFVPDIVTAGLKTVCLRMPAQSLTLDIIRKFGHPLAAPSANKSGRPSPTTLVDVTKEMPGLPVVDGGNCVVGLESTVVDVRQGSPRILRLGGISAGELENVLGEKVMVVYKNTSSQVISPGMQFKHYAPKGKLILVWPNDFPQYKNIALKNMKSKKKHVSDQKKLSKEKVYSSVEEALTNNKNYKTGIICATQRANLYKSYEVLHLGLTVQEQAQNLYKTLHKTEDLGWEKIIVDMSDIGGGDGIGQALLERLQRAAE